MLDAVSTSPVLRVMAILEDQWMMGTIGDKPKSSLNTGLSSVHSRIKNFVSSDTAKGVFHSAASKAFNTVKEHHKSIIATAATMALTHIADVDLPGDLEDHVHHQIEHLGTTLGITKDMAHHVLHHAVKGLMAMRGLKEAVEKDDELDAALIRLHKTLKKLEPHYRGQTKPKETPKDTDNSKRKDK